MKTLTKTTKRTVWATWIHGITGQRLWVRRLPAGTVIRDVVFGLVGPNGEDVAEGIDPDGMLVRFPEAAFLEA